MMETPDINDRLKAKYQEMRSLAESFIGYPCNKKFHYEALYRFLEMPLNNIGAPDAPSNYQLNTHEFEQEVIQFTAQYYDHDDDHWGYITNGGSEGNLCGLHMARSRLPEAHVFYSSACHYSIAKAVDITRAKATEIPADPKGEIDYNALDQTLSQHAGKPVILILNHGTTMTGAMDRVDKVQTCLTRHNINESHIHVDAALHGYITPFTKNPHKFALAQVDSLSISGHKFLGSPIPCGIFLTHQHHMEAVNYPIEYVGINDATITGSRNAITPLILWYAIFQFGNEGLQKRVNACLDNATYAIEQCQLHNMNAWAHPYSPIVIIDKPSDAMIHKWQLASQGDIAHIVIMPHVDKALIDRFVQDLVADGLGQPINDSHINLKEDNNKQSEWLNVCGLLLGTAAALGIATTFS